MAPLFNAIVGGESLSSLRCPYASEGQNAAPCQILCRSVKPLRKSGHFSIFKMAAIYHLGFLKLGNFNCPYPSGAKMRHPAKFCADRLNRCGDMVVFNFSRWRPSAILDWFYACWDHPRRVLGGLCDCAKFGGNRCSAKFGTMTHIWPRNRTRG